MDAEEMIWWVMRIVAIIFTAAILTLIITLAQPDVETGALAADALAGRIAYAGGFSSEPGVVQATRFTQSVADEQVRIVGETLTGAGAKAWVETDSGETDPVYYAKAAYDKNAALQATAGIGREVRKLPVLYERASGERTPAVLAVEVLYEE